MVLVVEVLAHAVEEGEEGEALLGGGVGDGGDVPAGDDEGVAGGEGVVVAEGEGEVVLVNEVGWIGGAEGAGGWVGHGGKGRGI